MNVPVFMQKLTAKLLADMLYKPFGPVRPSKKAVMERTMKDVGFDQDGFLKWEKEEFNLQNDGIAIPASYFPVPNAKGVAVLAHGYGQNRYVLIPQAEIFRELGYSVIMFDQRHFGESKAPNGTFSMKEADDLVALVKWAKNKCGSETRIITLGVSMGAMTVMNAISRTDQIDAAIEDCGPARLSEIGDSFFEVAFGFKNPYFPDAAKRATEKYGMSLDQISPIESVKKSDIPLLVIHSEGDRTVSVKSAYAIAEASKNPLSRKKIFGAYDHAFSIVERDTYKTAVSDFLNDVFREEN